MVDVNVPPAMTPPTDVRLDAYEHLSTAVLVVGADDTVLAVNPAAETLLAVSARQASGTPIGRLFPEPNPCPGLMQAARCRGVVIAETALELPLFDGRVVRADCTVTPLAGGDDGSSMLLELTDVERRLRVSQEETLLAQNETARILLRGLAHEIRNPLGGLRGAAQLLEREFDEPAVKEYTSVIIAEADRLQVLLERMLGPRTAPRREPINIHQVTERVFALAEAEAGSGVQVERDYDPSIPDLVGDYDLLIQALLNIVRNAIQALDGKGKVILRTRVRRNAHVGSKRHRLVAQIEVIDNGPGIPEALASSLFYPLVTGRADGTGLGLSVAQSLIAHHGGLIECHCAPHGGSGNTRFCVLLPIEP